jgi:thiamine biosynthesis lipoprotein
MSRGELMHTIGPSMTRRSFLKLPALLPLSVFGSALQSREHHFKYECVIGTSMDLVVWTPHSHVAERACRIVVQEIDRLACILNTRDPASEIRLLEDSNSGRKPSHELAEVFDAYDYWERRTNGVFSIHLAGLDMPRNVDALGKAYIIDRAADAARKACTSIDGLLLNIGGDIVAWGRSCEIAIADPAACYDNAEPMAMIELHNAAVATSGTYARGAHLIDAQSGQSLRTAAAATVIAPDAVTANALATTLCLTKADAGLKLVESTPGAEALRVESGVLRRTSGFALLERPFLPQAPVQSDWPHGYQLTVTLPLTSGRSKKRPYVAVWVEDSSGKLVRVLAFWGNNSKYQPDLSTIWSLLKKTKHQLQSVTRATRPAGRYELVWDGLDNEQNPVPFGTYRITVETNQEHGTYAKQSGTITLGDSPASITLPATTNFEAVLVQYGPK